MKNSFYSAILVLSATALLAGCSDGNFEASEEVHPTDWYRLHRTDTTLDAFGVDCGGCHVVAQGQDGPASPPSCYSVNFEGVGCHADGPGQASHAVGDSWLLPTEHATQAINATLDCVGCHTLAGGGIDPACQACHQVAPKMDLTTNGCSSCHSYPPDGVTPSATQPNRAGQHAGHVGLTQDTGDCSACHQGGGSGSSTHYDRVGTTTTPDYPAEVNFLPAYNAGSATAAYSAQYHTCSAVSCHGGELTPDWYDGTLPTTAPSSSNDYCLSCHSSYAIEGGGIASGQHDEHVAERKMFCTFCHNLTILQGGVDGSGPTHWSNLSSSGFELLPALTVGGGSSLVTNYDGVTCTASCHNARPW
ncbi:MAG: hypothetical protein KJ950_13105 [Proteobacteria bacterium]|nr:hypothetical protein [Pseudomonadota bacterium]MBU1688416.1 hypothetical protein [Pseudomonadota bacterium]